MTALKASDVDRFSRNPDLRQGVFLAYGPDAGLVRETAQTLAKSLAGKEPAEVITIDISEVDGDPARIGLEARTNSLFGEKRIIRVRGTSKTLVLPLTDVLDDPGGAAIIVEGGNLAPRDPLRALIENNKSGRALPCYADSDATLGALIRDAFAQAGIAADADTVAALRDTLGNDREVTRREIDKLSLYALETKQLSRADVELLCADNAAMVLDEIIDAVGTGHAAKLEAALDRAMANALNAQQILTMALNHFAGLRRWRGDVDRGRSARDVIENLKPRPHFSRKSALEQQLRLWNDAALSSALERLQTAINDSRRLYGVQDVIARRALLAVCMTAAEH